MTKYLLLYDAADDVLATAPVHYDEHVAVLAPFRDSGVALFASPLDDPRNGAVSVWADRASAEAFAVVDPFVLHGVVARWHLVEWPDEPGTSRPVTPIH
jgi:uncharacterized protein